MTKVIKILGLEIEYDRDGNELVFFRTDHGIMSLQELVEELEEANDVKGKLIIH